MARGERSFGVSVDAHRNLLPFDAHRNLLFSPAEGQISAPLCSSALDAGDDAVCCPLSFLLPPARPARVHDHSSRVFFDVYELPPQLALLLPLFDRWEHERMDTSKTRMYRRARKRSWLPKILGMRHIGVTKFRHDVLKVSLVAFRFLIFHVAAQQRKSQLTAQQLLDHSLVRACCNVVVRYVDVSSDLGSHRRTSSQTLKSFTGSVH